VERTGDSILRLTFDDGSRRLYIGNVDSWGMLLAFLFIIQPHVLSINIHLALKALEEFMLECGAVRQS
jgi:hypothetical protein